MIKFKYFFHQKVESWNGYDYSIYDLWLIYRTRPFYLFIFYLFKGIDRGYFIFSASAKTNCCILELCIWLVSKLIGLPLLKRTPHQSKAEACYRQIAYFQKKTFECECAKTMLLHTSSRIYIIYETHKNGSSIQVLTSRS